VLAFEGADGHIEEGFAPAFNALNLFAVPMRHAVTQVASFAPRDRLSITGWLRSRQTV
jgi:Rps23 Pro-64 3,4-dihydroxylase Tpa1-like proline 4-hydroxylase